MRKLIDNHRLKSGVRLKVHSISTCYHLKDYNEQLNRVIRLKNKINMLTKKEIGKIQKILDERKEKRLLENLIRMHQEELPEEQEEQCEDIVGNETIKDLKKKLKHAKKKAEKHNHNQSQSQSQDPRSATQKNLLIISPDHSKKPPHRIETDKKKIAQDSSSPQELSQNHPGSSHVESHIEIPPEYQTISPGDIDLEEDSLFSEDMFSPAYMQLLHSFEVENAKLEEIKKMYLSDRKKYFAGRVFITMQTRQMAEGIDADFGTNISFWTKLLCPKPKIFKNHLSEGGISEMYKLKLASNPSDVIWENIGSSAWTTLKYRIVSYTVSLVLILVSLMILLGLKYFQRLMTVGKIKDSQDTAGYLSVGTFWVRVVSLGIILVIFMINSAIAFILRVITRFEKHTSTTAFMRSLSLKIVLVNFHLPLGPIYQYESTYYSHPCRNHETSRSEDLH